MAEGLAVTAFTDTYLPTLNGVTYTLAAWARRWNDSRGRMRVVYPASDHAPEPFEHPAPSAPFPFYDGYRAAAPWVPAAVRGADVVHSHSVFSLGVAGWLLARSRDVPFVASYHTPAAEYAEYVAPGDRGAALLGGALRRYESLVLRAADLVVVPSAETERALRRRVGSAAPLAVVSNGVDLDVFRPVDADAFERRYGLDDRDGPLIGYTGRHGREKRLGDLLGAAERLDGDAAPGGDVTVALGGGGPATAELKRLAADRDVDVRFLGVLDRAELPAFYSSLDVFGFPSPVETEGLVAMEAMACGTPVVGADAGALRSTVRDGETGHRFEAGSPSAMAEALRRALADRERLASGCLDRREELSMASTLDRLESLYRRL